MEGPSLLGTPCPPAPKPGPTCGPNWVELRLGIPGAANLEVSVEAGFGGGQVTELPFHCLVPAAHLHPKLLWDGGAGTRMRLQGS